MADVVDLLPYLIDTEQQQQQQEDDWLLNEGESAAIDENHLFRSASEFEWEEVETSNTNIVWEVLLSMNNQMTSIDNFEAMPDFEDDQDQDVFFMPSDYDFQFGLLDHHNIRASPPAAAEFAADSLPFILLADVGKDDFLCAICKDEFLLEEKVNQLPCSHVYHKDCILRWLRIRNTCPVCRFELPTD